MSGASRAGLSACVITRDEEDRIGDCLDSLAFCDEVVLVDSHSTDRTREIAEARGARVFERDWPGFGPQREFAAEQARNDWVLCIDADERVSQELRREIEALREAGFPGAAAFRFPRLSHYLGLWVRHGTWYPDEVVRLYHRRQARWAGRPPHDHLEVEGAVARLDADLLHHPYRDLGDHLATIDRYTSEMAKQLHAEGRRARVSDLVLRPLGRFLRFYVWKRGFLMGWRGLLMASLAAHYVRLKYAKLLLLQRGG